MSGRRRFTDEELAEIAEIAGDGCAVEIVRDYIDHDWGVTWHWGWIAQATELEIAEWIATARRDDKGATPWAAA